MAIREIKATLALDGEKKFKAGLDEMSRSLRVTDSGLKAIEASYGVTGDRSEMLTKKTAILKEELEQQKRIVAALSGAVQDAAREYGDTAKQTDGYRIKLNTALKKQAEMEKAIRDTERELDELGRESVSVGREIENGVGDAAEEAAKDLREMYDELQGDIRGINVSAGISAVKDLGGTIIDAGQGLIEFAEGSREYRRQMSFLERNAEAAGQDYERVKQLLFETAALTGDVDGAVEGISNLLAIGFDFSELVASIGLLKGAVITFPDTMKFESLADSLQETIATGEATGQYAELLGRLGVDLETFNKAMEKAESAEERQQVALSFLANNGLKETHDKYMETNGQLTRAEEATLKLKDQMATLGGTMDELVVTPVKEWLAGQVEEANKLIELIRNIDQLPQWISGTSEGTQTQKEAIAVLTGRSAVESAREIAEQAGNETASGFQDGYIEGMAENAWMYYENEALVTDWGTYFTNEMKEQGTEAGKAGVEGVKEGMEKAEQNAKSSAETIGGNVATSVGNGIIKETPHAISAAAAMVDGVNAELSRMGMTGGSNLTAGLYDRATATSGSRTASASGSGGVGTTVVPMYLDSSKVGEAIIPTVSAGIGTQIKQLVTIG